MSTPLVPSLYGSLDEFEYVDPLPSFSLLSDSGTSIIDTI